MSSELNQELQTLIQEDLRYYEDIVLTVYDKGSIKVDTSDFDLRVKARNLVNAGILQIKIGNFYRLNEIDYALTDKGREIAVKLYLERRNKP